MTSGFDALSLAIFTSLAPSGAVAFIVLALARMGMRDHDAAVRLDRMTALPFSVALVGFIASATHLGTPANALHVFSGIGRSPLSNEVLSAVLFLFLVGSYWMAAFKQRFANGLAHGWLALACGAGTAFVACTSCAYAVATVPTWNTAYTPANLVLSALFAGPILALLFLEAARVNPHVFEKCLVIASGAVLLAGTVVLALHNASLSGIANNELSASTLAPDYATAILAHFALGALSVAAAAWSIRCNHSRNRVLAIRSAASLLALAAVFATRIAFYQLHMTVGF